MARYRPKLPVKSKDSDNEAPVCGVKDCGLEPARSLSFRKVNEALSELTWRPDLGKPKRVQLCRDHYRQFRKTTKESRTLERLGRG